MRNCLVIFVNGKRHEIRGDAAFGMLSDFLRSTLGLCGTKVVCAEGDCGSCSIIAGRATKSEIRYQVICSCIQFLHQLDGAHVVTIEGLRYDGELNPIQREMVACHGAQCGYCTPGIVVALHAALENKIERAPQRIRYALVGNLCRCTGYDSIVSAALQTNPESIRSLNDLYPPTALYQELRDLTRYEVDIQTSDRRIFRPTSIESAVRFRAANPECTVVSGATDLGVQTNKGLREPMMILSIGNIETLAEIEHKENALHCGAATTIADMETACAAALPEYAQMLVRFGSPPIKAAATLGGNIVNGSPIGDSMPGLLVLNAEVELAGTGGRRQVNLNEFYTGYRQSVLCADELLVGIRVPLPDRDVVFKLYKISRRKDLDISAFTAAIWLRLHNGLIREARLAYGGVGPTIVRLTAVETFLRDAPFSLDTLEHAGELAASEVKPISDVRGSMDYRLALARNILIRLWHDLESQSSQAGDVALEHLQ